MKRALTAGALVAGTAGVTVQRRRAARSGEAGQDRWLVVTVNRPIEHVAPDSAWPAPLTALGDKIEVNVRAAPGGRGTELGARPRGKSRANSSGLRRLAGTDSRQDVRQALREAKQILEAGEVVRANAPGSTRKTLLGLPIDFAVRRARGEGRL